MHKRQKDYIGEHYHDEKELTSILRNIEGTVILKFEVESALVKLNRSGTEGTNIFVKEMLSVLGYFGIDGIYIVNEIYSSDIREPHVNQRHRIIRFVSQITKFNI